MHDSRQRPYVDEKLGADSLKGFLELSRQVMHLANEAIPRVAFLQRLSDLLLQFSGCDSLELLTRGQVEYIVRATARPTRGFRFESPPEDETLRQWRVLKVGHARAARHLLLHELDGAIDDSAPCFTQYGSFWTNDVRETLRQHGICERAQPSHDAQTTSMALIPFLIDEANLGLLRLECARAGIFSPDKIESYEAVVETIGLAIAQRRSQAAIRERVKELGCLYGIARVTEFDAVDLDTTLEGILLLLPPAWQYPDIAVSRITLDGRVYGSVDFAGTVARQTANIVIGGVRRGTVEVGYTEAVPHAIGGPFLQEEEHLIRAVARAVGEYVERRQSVVDRERLEKQLHHADRLATIGKLVAGVAHEINEPLSSILGFAQLAQKGQDVAGSTVEDLNRIVASCLQAREIVNKLMIFARQTPIARRWISVGDVVAEALSFVHGRCVSRGIDVVRQSAGDAHNVEADPVQLKQVLVNLAVNAIQAMPDGGTLTVSTRAHEDVVFIDVTDTGTGMTDEVIEQLFNPFFTTKDVGEGTGLGLSVVHGIVQAHGGEIYVESVVGKGSKFTVRLPVSGAATQHESSK